MEGKNKVTREMCSSAANEDASNFQWEKAARLLRPWGIRDRAERPVQQGERFQSDKTLQGLV